MLCLMPARPTVVRIFLAMCATAAVVSSVHATEPRPGEIAPVSIRNAVHMAWRQHPDQRMAEAQLAAARARLEAAGSPIHNPELVVEREDEGPDTTATIGLALALDLGGKQFTLGEEIDFTFPGYVANIFDKDGVNLEFGPHKVEEAEAPKAE